MAPSRSVASGAGPLLNFTLGQAVRDRSSSPSEPMAAAALRCRQCSRLAAPSRCAVHPSAIRSGHTQALDAKRWQPRASRPRVKRTAIRGRHFSAPATAIQFVVRASRGSAAPGNQRVVVSGARSCGAGGASGGARTSQQPRFMPQRHNASMASVIKSNASRAQNAWPNPAVNRTPCGSPRLAFISFWAKRGLPQGAGYLVR